MKKILLFALFIASSWMVNGQSTDLVKKLVDQEMSYITKRVSYNNSALQFNKNQVARLNKVVSQKAKEIATLRESDFEKAEYAEKYQLIVDKYDPKIEKILTSEQRFEYRRNESARISLQQEN